MTNRRGALLLSVMFSGAAFLISPHATAASTAGVKAGLQAPAGSRPTRIDRSGVTVIPSGRLITPRGVQVSVAPHPYGMALSPDGRTLVTVNSGTAPFSISIVTNLASAYPTVVQIPPRIQTIRRRSQERLHRRRHCSGQPHRLRL